MVKRIQDCRLIKKIRGYRLYRFLNRGDKATRLWYIIMIIVLLALIANQLFYQYIKISP